MCLLAQIEVSCGNAICCHRCTCFASSLNSSKPLSPAGTTCPSSCTLSVRRCLEGNLPFISGQKKGPVLRRPDAHRAWRLRPFPPGLPRLIEYSRPLQNRVPTARTTKQASCWTRSGKAAEYRDSFSKDTFYDLRHELVLRHLRNREIQTVPCWRKARLLIKRSVSKSA